MDVSKFIKAPEYDVKIITRRDVFQASIYEEDRFSDECLELSALIVLDTAEMKHMGILDGANVRLTSKWGSVVVRAMASPREEQKGLGFMVNGPWVNALVSDETPDGIPAFKDIEAKITISKDRMTGILELLLFRHGCF
ncbi:MAG: formylmethanofuran dehydrogenase [ANME-2 cluster archaeon]|nr:formylmethanofuran dehydrogenase [ANME-2 cluster archaeon]MBC2702017.1 formylmethanofuran dehydrogenase [ANME-2 cluster archaeon]MBC2706661.1 formylmethanofuran dehydrogenase [ANME-2 cluster archaeon]MBC2748724.1 formylmethanofuran dehydrogenase [ANME-2 cluster archaeon]MBC2763484.1 formylmethanofuran dehydrogenase [ANME-2 cluster archaeon]